jgi:hypothetical protein
MHVELERKNQQLEGSLDEVRLQNEGLLRHFSEAAEYKGKLTKVGVWREDGDGTNVCETETGDK